MKRIIRYACAAALLLVSASCGRKVLERGDWTKEGYGALVSLIKEYGNTSESFDVDNAPYAVFDFDNTVIDGDISLVTMAYQIENLCYKIDPEDFYLTLTNCVPNVDCALDPFRGVSARMLSTDLFNDYAFLYDNYIKDGKMELEQIRKTDQYKDFRAKLWALSLGADTTFGYETGCLWILRLFSGMTQAELASLVREAAADAMDMKKSEERWISPDEGEVGVVEVIVPRGMRIRPDMINLMNSLKENGIDVYICSASAERIVEALACDGPFGLDESSVYGLRLSSQGIVSSRADYASGYPKTFHEGKVELIRRFISPSHGGTEPLLVAGDSGGDRQMLTAFPQMKLGILVEGPYSSSLDELKNLGDGRYFVQKWK